MKPDLSGTIIAVDFDGTCVTHAFPEVGADIGAVPVLQELVKRGARLILWTCRSGAHLQPATDWFARNGIPLWGINQNPEQTTSGWTTSPKAFAHLYIDDLALGSHLLFNPEISKRGFVNWAEVARQLL